MSRKTKSKREFTYADLVRRLWGPLTDEQVDHLLWSCTSFPCTSALQVARDVKRAKRMSGGDLDKAVALAYEELNLLMEQVWHQQIAERAFQKYVARGCLDGFAEQDWHEAEKEIFPWRFRDE